MSNDMLLDNLEMIAESIELIEQRFKGIGEAEDFVNNFVGVEILDSICMRLQIIGELTKKIDKMHPKLLNNYPDVEWPNIMKLRDIISHHYEQIDYEIIFDICRNHVPLLKQMISKILKDAKER